jgi:hypothetical protein
VKDDKVIYREWMKKIILELKAVSTLSNVFKQQTLSYLKAANLNLAFSSTLAHRALNTPASQTGGKIRVIRYSWNS